MCREIIKYAKNMYIIFYTSVGSYLAIVLTSSAYAYILATFFVSFNKNVQSHINPTALIT